jgi:hypothetical protein
MKKALKSRKPANTAVRRRLELAGMMDGDGGSRIGRHVETLTVVRPDRVWLSEDATALIYTTEAPLVSDVPKPEALDVFVALANATPEAICAFAQKFGVLDVDALATPGLYQESIEAWRGWIARLGAILAGAASLHSEQPIGSPEWEAVNASTATVWAELINKQHRDASAKQRQLFVQRLALTDVLNELLSITRIRPCFTWFRNSGILLTNLHGFFNEGSLSLSGYLAAQLVLACGRADSIATCSGCGVPYMRRWRSTTGRRNYCQACGLRAAWRDSKRAKRMALAQGVRTARNSKRGGQ